MRDGVSGIFRLVPKADAVVSVFDSNFLIGDGIWVGEERISYCLLRTVAEHKKRKELGQGMDESNLPKIISIDSSSLRKQCSWISDFPRANF